MPKLVNSLWSIVNGKKTIHHRLQAKRTINQTGFAPIAILIMLLSGVALGTYLVQNRTNILPFAQDSSFYCNGNSLYQSIDLFELGTSEKLVQDCSDQGMVCSDSEKKCVIYGPPQPKQGCTAEISDDCAVTGKVCIEDKNGNPQCVAKTTGGGSNTTGDPAGGGSNTTGDPGGSQDCEQIGQLVSKIGCSGKKNIGVWLVCVDDFRIEKKEVADQDCKESSSGKETTSPGQAGLSNPQGGTDNSATSTEDDPACQELKGCIYSQGQNECYRGVCSENDCGFNKNCKYIDQCSSTSYNVNGEDKRIGEPVTCPNLANGEKSVGDAPSDVETKSNSCSDSNSPKGSNGYKWIAYCDNGCSKNTDCPKNTSSGFINPDSSNWCYQFSDGNKCLKLVTEDDKEVKNTDRVSKSGLPDDTKAPGESAGSDIQIQACTDNPEGALKPDGYTWLAYCDKKCSTNEQCKGLAKGSGFVNPDTAYWCYGGKCLNLVTNDDKAQIDDPERKKKNEEANSKGSVFLNNQGEVNLNTDAVDLKRYIGDLDSLLNDAKAEGKSNQALETAVTKAKKMADDTLTEIQKCQSQSNPQSCDAGVHELYNQAKVASRVAAFLGVQAGVPNTCAKIDFGLQPLIKARGIGGTEDRVFLCNGPKDSSGKVEKIWRVYDKSGNPQTVSDATKFKPNASLENFPDEVKKRIQDAEKLILGQSISVPSTSSPSGSSSTSGPTSSVARGDPQPLDYKSGERSCEGDWLLIGTGTLQEKKDRGINCASKDLKCARNESGTYGCFKPQQFESSFVSCTGKSSSYCEDQKGKGAVCISDGTCSKPISDRKDNNESCTVKEDCKSLVCTNNKCVGSSPAQTSTSSASSSTCKINSDCKDPAKPKCDDGKCIKR